MVTVIVKVHVYCWKYHLCINWYNIFRVYIYIYIYICRNEDINMSLKASILPTLKLIFVQAVLNTVVYQMLIAYTNVLVNSAVLLIAVYGMCYSVINPCGYWTSGTLSALASNGNTLYNVMGVKRHIMLVDLPESESIS